MTTHTLDQCYVIKVTEVGIEGSIDGLPWAEADQVVTGVPVEVRQRSVPRDEPKGFDFCRAVCQQLICSSQNCTWRSD